LVIEVNLAIIYIALAHRYGKQVEHVGV